MNTIGIDHNLDRAKIRKLLAIGLFAAILTGIGDFVLGYGHAENMEGCGLAASVLASAPNLADWQMIVGGLLATLPDQESFDRFQEKISILKSV